MDVALSSIPTEGIIGMELEDLRQADRFGYTVKLLGIALRHPEGLDVRVHPAFIPKRYLLAAVRDEFNGIYLRGEATGSMLFYGKGAGALPTAQAVLGDVLVTARECVSGVKVLGSPPRHDPERRLPLDMVRRTAPGCWLRSPPASGARASAWRRCSRPRACVERPRSPSSPTRPGTATYARR
jgi:hypothetical protein